jgi:hypothetical protein
MEVYSHSGQTVTDDPRRTERYREAVINQLKLDEAQWEASRPDLSRADRDVLVEVVRRNAAMFWFDGELRTVVRHVKHDTVPTGPPVKMPPHNIKGEDARFVDKSLDDELARGAVVRGNSDWGSAPFPTKVVAEHKKQSKKRMVVDYRRVNARTERAVYYTRKSSDVLSEAAGSLWFTFLDAVAGFNHIRNTQRAMEMLAIVWRTGHFLPVCLTFGPHNGPEDFGYVVDRIYASGSRGKRRYCKEWLGFVDDLTIRTGRMVDGVLMTDEEHDQRVAVAADKAHTVGQPLKDAFEALGLNADSLGAEKGARPLKAPPRAEKGNKKGKDKVAVVLDTIKVGYCKVGKC